MYPYQNFQQNPLAGLDLYDPGFAIWLCSILAVRAHIAAAAAILASAVLATASYP